MAPSAATTVLSAVTTVLSAATMIPSIATTMPSAATTIPSIATMIPLTATTTPSLTTIALSAVTTILSAVTTILLAATMTPSAPTMILLAATTILSAATMTPSALTMILLAVTTILLAVTTILSAVVTTASVVTTTLALVSPAGRRIETWIANRCEDTPGTVRQLCSVKANLTYVSTLSVVPHHTPIVKVTLLSARSVCNKALQINEYICEHEYDIVAITEMWLRKKLVTTLLSLKWKPGFVFRHVARSSRHGGSIAILHHDTFAKKVLPSLH